MRAYRCRTVKERGGYKVPLYFPSTKESGQFYAIPCAIVPRSGHCILDTGSDRTQIAATSETSQFKILNRVKSVSMYGERVENMVEVPQLTLGDDFTKKNIPANRSNSFPDLPNYLAVIGYDVLIDTDIVFDFGTGESNPAKLILDPNYDELASYSFKEFDTILDSKRFIIINLTIEVAQ